jgi:hypothetical protein
LWTGDQPYEMGAALPAISLGATTPKEIRSKGNSTCALMPDDTLKCWGSSEGLVLGNGAWSLHRGDKPGEMTNVPSVNFGSNSSAQAHKVGSYCMGHYHMCAVITNSDANKSGLMCFGYNFNGVVGSGVANAWITSPTFYSLGLKADGITPIRPTKLACGTHLTCAMTNDNKVKCWGSNNSGSLGQEAATDFVTRKADTIPYINFGTGRTVKDVAVGAAHACALLDNGQVKCWGSNVRGQLGIEDAVDRGTAAGQMGDDLPYVNLGTTDPVLAIEAAGDNTCAILKSGRLKCWGSGVNGMNGLENALDIGKDRGQMGTALAPVDLGPGRTVLSVSMGPAHVCAVLDNNGIKCWGNNTKGQLGVGDTSRRGATYPSMGTLLPFVPQ